MKIQPSFTVIHIIA